MSASDGSYRLRRFRISGYKALNRVDILIPKQLLFLIGNNGSGKSSVLQALGFIQYFVRGRSDQFFDDRGWKPSQVRTRLSGVRTNPLTFELCLQIADVDLYWQFSWSLSSGRLISESIWIRKHGLEPERIVRYRR